MMKLCRWTFASVVHATKVPVPCSFGCSRSPAANMGISIANLMS